MEKIMQHRLATPVFQPRMYFFDADGKPLVGGKAYSFKVGTDEFKPTYRNSEFTAANQNPVLLDQAGSALIYVRGSNQLKIYNKQGNLIEEKIVYQQQMQTQFFDNYGKALSNGKIWTYDYQSTIKKASYKNADEALLNSNPVVLDQNGWGSISIVGAYRLRVLNKNNVVIGDQDFKRPPVQVLTSRIYPLYFKESFSTLSNLDSLIRQRLINQSSTTEHVNTQFTVLNPVRKIDVFYSETCLLELIKTQFTALSPVRKQMVIYSSQNLLDTVSTQLSAVNAKRQKVLISTNMKAESLTTHLNVLNPKRKQV